MISRFLRFACDTGNNPGIRLHRAHPAVDIGSALLQIEGKAQSGTQKIFADFGKLS